MLAFAAFLELANAVVVAWCPRTLIFCSFVFTHLTSPLNFFQCLDVVGSEWIPDRADILKHRSHECFVCCVSESFICSFVKRQDTNAYLIVNALGMCLIPCAHYTDAQRKKAVTED